MRGASINSGDGRKAAEIARKAIERWAKKREKFLAPEKLPGIFQEKFGFFVSLHTYPRHELRGCIGIPYPIKQLKETIIEASISACHDPRFPPLEENELGKIVVEVSILSKPEVVKDVKKIKIGGDGLIIQHAQFSGLLLPQVPVEQKWDLKEYLEHLCLKAGLSADAWSLENTKIYKFQAKIFEEIKPRGGIREKHLKH